MIDERIQLVADTLAKSKAVIGVICFGSRALGREDEHSDADLYVFTRGNVPAEAVRKRALKAMPGASGLRLDCPGNDRQWWPVEDKLILRGLRFEIHYSRLDRIAGIVRKVRQGRLSLPELRFRPHTMPGLLANSVALHDADGSLARLLRGLYPYPAKLRRALARSSMEELLRLLGDLRDAAERGFGASAFLCFLAFMNGHLSALLHAINNRYDPATKRLEQDLALLKVVPANFMARYRSMQRGPFDARGQRRAAKEYSRLIAETKALI